MDIDARKEFLARYLIEDVPCVLFFDGQGALVMRKENEYTNAPEKLVSTMEAAKKAAVDLESLETDLESRTLSSPNDPEVAIELGNHYYDTYRFEPALEAFRRAARFLPESAADRADDVMLRIIYLEIVLARYDDAVAEIDRFLANRPTSPRRDYVSFYRGYTAYQRHDLARAATEWKDFLAKYPTSPLRKDVGDYLESLGN